MGRSKVPSVLCSSYSIVDDETVLHNVDQKNVRRALDYIELWSARFLIPFKATQCFQFTVQCSPQDFLKGYWGLHNQNFLGYVIHYYVIMMS